MIKKIASIREVKKLRNGWTAHTRMYIETKKDGTVDQRKSPRPGRWSMHVHENGHYRLYRNNVLFAEKYACGV